ncbi:ATP-binding protein [Niallia nealsonii]|uniref:ATP-binding protein n=1 Tax=Niallia nealsonii TaxID=115979 RepID=A0A2N0Z2F6_9BACI|nr:ATP-binding protein [Niallia nealsonii]PKG23677.1 ATP-binding protein [Niallia nealsonii]
MRDVQILLFNKKEEIVIAADNSGGIGLKEQDVVKVDYETVAYFSFRVACMECMAAGGIPFSVILQNFCGEIAWNKLVVGIKKSIKEAGLEELAITGSTESNFALNQSAVGLTVLGKKGSKHKSLDMKKSKVAVIGSPLVGNEVMEEKEKIAPLSLFYPLVRARKYNLLPVGSKGILAELSVLLGKMEEREIHCALDINKSAGPSTCFLIEYEEEEEQTLRNLAGPYFHSISFIEK